MADGTTRVTLSRQDLYERVWNSPVQALAKEFGVTGRGLSKICERLDIPVPPRGYWAKIASGRKVAKYRLPPPGPNTPPQVTISATPLPAPPEALPELVLSLIAEDKRLGRPIAVPKTLSGAHRVVAAWIEESRKRAAEARRWGTGYVPEVIGKAPLEKRRLRILSALFREAERRGHRVIDNLSMYCRADIQVAGEKVEFKLRERIRVIKTPASPDDRRANPKKKWRQTSEPSDELELVITSQLMTNAAVTKWRDTPEQSLEQQLDDILTGFAVAGVLLAELRRKREEAECVRREEEQRRYEIERLEKIDNNRWRHVQDMTARWRQSIETREFLSALEAKAVSQAPDGVLAPEQVEWFSWAKERLYRESPLSYKVAHLIEQNHEADAYQRPMQWADEKEDNPYRRG